MNNTIRRLRSVLSVFLFFICLSGASAKEFNLVSLQYPPYVYKEDGRVTGFIYDVVEEAFRRMGHTTKVDINSWPRSLAQVKTGKAAAIFTAYKNPERETFLDYSNNVLIQQEIVLFIPRGGIIPFTGDLKELANYKLGIVRGISYGTIFDDAVKQDGIINTVEATTLEQSIRKLNAGRIDILISNKYTALSMFKQLGFQDKFVQLDVPVQSVPSYIAFSKALNLSALRDAFDQTLEGMISDGSYEKIISTYVK
ncbi:substrate-binding periplasmic protein [Psychromonas aquimarina]|uniref:substrate-binding periplasmic protein n=1 Tax=Psychromonas aquimarina TaxID=444919 RepID=UPI000423EF86|nr:transporter substrate-binding domain-containing protein [Psychromonas aquimarina]